MKTRNFIMRLILHFSIKIELRALVQIVIHGIRATIEICNNCMHRI